MRRTGLAGLVGAAVASAVIAAPASAAFGPAFNVSGASDINGSPDVAVSEQGAAAFVWSEFTGTGFRVVARTRSANGTFSAIRPLSVDGFDAHDPRVAFAPNGTAIFVWEQFDGSITRIRTRTLSPSGTLGAGQYLSPNSGDAEDPQLAVDGDGDAVYVWDRFIDSTSDFTVETRTRFAAGTLSSPQPLSPDEDTSFASQVGVTPSGNAVFVWRNRIDPSGLIRIRSRARSASGTLSAGQFITAAGVEGFTPDVGVADNGAAVFTWEESDGSNQRIRTRVRTPASSLTSPQNLSPAGASSNFPKVAVAPDGDAAFAFESFLFGDTRAIARARSATGALSALQPLSAAGQEATQPKVAIADGGRAFFIWSRSDGSSVSCCGRTQTVERSPAGALGAVQTLSPAGVNVIGPEIATNSAGAAAATWGVGGPERLQGAVQVSNPPPTPPSNEFTIGKAKKNKKRGTAKLPVELPGPGTLELAGKKLKPVEQAVTATASGSAATIEATLKVKPKGKAKKGLKKKGKAKVKPEVTYTPTGGTANTQTTSVKLKKKR